MILGLVFWGQIVLQAPLAQARISAETWSFEGMPAENDVARWEALKGKRTYHLKLFSLNSQEAQTLTRLAPTAAAFQLEFEVLPEEVSVYTAFRKLVAAGVPVDFIGEFKSLPTSERWDDLRNVGFRSFRFVLDHYPYPFEPVILNAFRPEQVTVIFQTKAYPKYVEKDSIAAIASGVTLEFHQDYWPLYPQVDTLKLIANPKVIRVRDMVPAEPTFSYLKTMTSLRELVADAMFFPAESSFWNQFGSMPLNWVQRDPQFDEQAIRAFEASAGSGPRRVRLERDEVPSADEMALFRHSRLDVELWVPAP